MASLPLWMAQVPEYTVVNGHMEVSVGEFKLAMPINIFLIGCAKGKAAIVSWERERHADAEVIAFRRELAGKH